MKRTLHHINLATVRVEAAGAAWRDVAGPEVHETSQAAADGGA